MSDRDKQSSLTTAADPVEGFGNGDKIGEEKRWYHPVKVFGFLLDNWFLIGIGVCIVLAWRFPHVAAEGGVIRSEYSIKYGAIALIFLITGLTLSTRSLYHQLRNWRLHLFTQLFSFLFFPAIVFAIVNIIHAAQSDRAGEEGGSGIDKYVLAGMVVMSVMPTTVASNISMTRSAGGSTEAATMQVCIGNLLGTFFTPLLCELFFSSSAWAYGQPIPAGGGSSTDGLREIYRQLAKQLGLTLFVPLFVGQVIQNCFMQQTKWVANTFRLPKVATFLLLLLIWTVFSTQFYEHAFEAVSTPSILFMVFVNLALYAVFTLLCVLLTRLPFLPSSFDPRFEPSALNTSASTVSSPVTTIPRRIPRWRRAVMGFRFDKKESTAICFCAAAKGMPVGVSTISVLYGGFGEQQKAILLIPLVLYQAQQVAVAQILVWFFKRWNDKPDRLAPPKKAAQAEAEAESVAADLDSSPPRPGATLMDKDNPPDTPTAGLDHLKHHPTA
ncbi:hypothetical protein IAU60_000769 [Kwoniella sp. DSM 27419]